MQKRRNCGHKGALAFLLVVALLILLILPSVSSGVVRVSSDCSTKLSGPRSDQLVIHSQDSCEAGTTSTFTVAENTAKFAYCPNQTPKS